MTKLIQITSLVKYTDVNGSGILEIVNGDKQP